MTAAISSGRPRKKGVRFVLAPHRGQDNARQLGRTGIGFEGNQPFFGGWSLGWNNEFTLTETIDPVITSVEPVLNFFNPAPSGTPALLNELALFVANVGGLVERTFLR